jgi:hypothetical protein
VFLDSKFTDLVDKYVISASRKNRNSNKYYVNIYKNYKSLSLMKELTGFSNSTMIDGNTFNLRLLNIKDQGISKDIIKKMKIKES